MELTSSSSLIPRAINCCSYGAKGSVKGAFLERLGAQVVGGLSGLNCYRQSFPQKGRDRSVLSSGKEFPLRVSTKASNSDASQDTDDMYDDLFKKYGKVVFKSSDQKSSIAEVDDDAESLSFAVELAKVASEVKAGDIKVLFVKRLVYWTRFFIIATAFSRPQIEAIGSRIRDLAEKQYGRFPTGDYKPNSWTLLDFGDVVVHIMLPPQRDYYNLEEFYANATPHRPDLDSEPDPFAAVKMNNVAAKIAVVGSGISGAVCASTLARNGFAVTLFESARGPGGRMSQRRETTEDGKELVFDHGAPFFLVNNDEVLDLCSGWEKRGLVTEWMDKFGVFDRSSNKFIDPVMGRQGKRYVALPGMNSICKALSNEPGVESKYGVGVGKMEWLNDENMWMLIGYDGSTLGRFAGVVASDKNVVSSRIKEVTGRAPPLDINLVPELAVRLQDVPVNPCFVLMMAFSESLQSIPIKAFSIRNSEILKWAHCDSSKPGRSSSQFVSTADGYNYNECWILHSTSEYARTIIAQTGLGKPSSSTLAKVAEELLGEFQSTDLNIPKPFFAKAHRWGSAFPTVSVAKDERCLFSEQKRIAICGDFCVSPSVEGAILSGSAAASKLAKICSCL
ncbi:unnamed protein product [Rhodiola kirilowii]